MQQNSYIVQDDLTFHRLTVFIGNVCISAAYLLAYIAGVQYNRQVGSFPTLWLITKHIVLSCLI